MESFSFFKSSAENISRLLQTVYKTYKHETDQKKKERLLERSFGKPFSLLLRLCDPGFPDTIKEAICSYRTCPSQEVDPMILRKVQETLLNERFQSCLFTLIDTLKTTNGMFEDKAVGILEIVKNALAFSVSREILGLDHFIIKFFTELGQLARLSSDHVTDFWRELSETFFAILQSPHEQAAFISLEDPRTEVFYHLLIGNTETRTAEDEIHADQESQGSECTSTNFNKQLLFLLDHLERHPLSVSKALSFIIDNKDYTQKEIDYIFERAMSITSKTAQSVDLIISCGVSEKKYRKEAISTIENVLNNEGSTEEIIFSALGGMQRLASVDDDLTVTFVDILLTSIFNLSTKKANDITAQLFSNAVIDLLKQSRNFTSVKSSVSIIVGKLRSNAPSPSQKSKREKTEPFNLVTDLLAKICITLESEEVVEIVAPQLCSCISPDLFTDDFSVLKALLYIGTIGNGKHLNEISETVLGFIKELTNELKEEESWETSPKMKMVDEIIGIIYNISQLHLSQGALEGLLRKLLLTFQQIARGLPFVKSQQLPSKTPVSRVLLSLIKIFTQLASCPQLHSQGQKLPSVCKSDDPNELIPQQNASLARLWTSVWINASLVFFTLTHHGVAESKNDVVDMSAAVPHFAARKPHYKMELEKEITTAITSIIDENSRRCFLNALCTELNANIGVVDAEFAFGGVGQVSGYIRSLTDEQVVYAYLGYSLESCRIANCEFNYLFDYLDDTSLDAYVSGTIQGGVLHAIKQLIDEIEDIPNVIDKTNIVTKMCCTIITAIGHSNKTIQQAATRYLKMIVNQYQQVLVKKECIATLFELFFAAKNVIQESPIAVTLKTFKNGSQISFPDSAAPKVELQNLVTSTIREWILRAISYAPQAALSSVQQSLLERKKSAGLLPLLLEVTGNYADEFFSEFQTKEAVLGAITNEDEMSSSVLSTLVSKAESNFASCKECFLQYKKRLNAFHHTDKSKLSESSYVNERVELSKLLESVSSLSQRAVFYAGALISAFRTFNFDRLIKKLVWYPIKVFTEKSISSAIVVWNWILASREDLSESLLSQIAFAWNYTLKEGYGIFSVPPLPKNPLSLEKEKVVDNSHFANPKPHQIWIDFLKERFTIAKQSNCLEQSILLAMVNVALDSCHHLGSLSSLGFLGVIGGIESHAIKAVLQYFTRKPEWYNPQNHKELEADVEAMIRLCMLLSKKNRFAQSNSMLLSSKLVQGTEKLPRSQTLQSIKAAALNCFDFIVNHSVPLMHQEQNTNQEHSIDSLKKLLILLLGNEVERMTVWNNPLNRKQLQIPNERLFSFPNISPKDKLTWKEYVDLAWNLSPKIAYGLVERFPDITNSSGTSKVRELFTEHLLLHPEALIALPEAVLLLVTEENVLNDLQQLKILYYCTAPPPTIALSLLSPRYHAHPAVTQYAVRALRSFDTETTIFYLPQILQALRYDKSGLVEQLLLDAARQSDLVAHQIIWNANTYPEHPDDPNYFVDPEFGKKVAAVRKRIIDNFTEEQRKYYEEEFAFIEQFPTISGKLVPVEKLQRKTKLAQFLSEVNVPGNGHAYLPTVPQFIVQSVSSDNAACLQSAAKVPILVNFQLAPRERPDAAPLKMGCIFKSGDDIRQDMLALQVMQMFKNIFTASSLHLYLCPYRIIATQPGCGIIEVVENSMSRDQLGKVTSGTMYDYFVDKYGPEHTPAFQQARANFIESMAAYSVFSYILQVKDRHNGNILIDNLGHIVHIDFGFLFDISPGGDLKFEKSPFKLTDEMIAIMGGQPTAEQFIYFMEQGVKALLSSRPYAESIITLCEMMVDTKLPCFKPLSMANLRNRFALNASVIDAAKFMLSVMIDAFSTVGSWTSYLYDVFQNLDNGIAM